MLALRGLVARRLYGGFADTKQQAVGKQIVSTDDNGGFCMHRVSGSCCHTSYWGNVGGYAARGNT